MNEATTTLTRAGVSEGRQGSERTQVVLEQVPWRNVRRVGRDPPAQLRAGRIRA